MDFQQVQYSIDVLIQRVRTGRLALPDFQRDFVWNPSRVVELIDSVSRQWPIGSLLLLSGPQPFAIRAIDSGPNVVDETLDLYILDGQQRVTSLYHAVANVSEFCYYIDFNALAQDSDEYISWERRKVFEKNYPTIEARAKSKLALIKDVWDLENFYAWLNQLESDSIRSQCVSLREEKLPGLHAKVYKIMAIVLDQSIQLEALARIFETLNRTGVALNAFDLMVATLYPSGFRLRDEWERAQELHSIIPKFSPDELEPLKLIALLVRANLGKKMSRGVRQGDLLRLDRSEIRKNWREAIDLYAAALDYCSKHFGVTCAEVIPSWAMILGVCGWIRFHKNPDRAIHAWWKSRLRTQYYSQAANTRIVADFDIIATQSAESHDFDTAADHYAVDTPSKANGLLMRGMGAQLINSGAIDIFTGAPLSSSEKVVFRAISSTGILRRLNSSDILESTIIVSADADRRLGTTTQLSQLGEAAALALERQGITGPTFKRSPEYFDSLFSEISAKEAK